MVAPSAENSSAPSRPSPEPDPVITTTLSASLSVMSSLPLRRAGDGLDPQVFAEPCDAVLDAVAADAPAAERGVGRQVERVVDVHGARVQLVRNGPRAGFVARLDVGRQAVPGVVGDAHRLGGVAVVADDGEHRPEHLGLGDLGVLVDVGDNRWLVPESLAVAVAALAAAQHPSAVGPGAVDEALDAFELLGPDDRSHQIAGIGGVTPRQVADDGLQPLQY